MSQKTGVSLPRSISVGGLRDRLERAAIGHGSGSAVYVETPAGVFGIGLKGAVDLASPESPARGAIAIRAMEGDDPRAIVRALLEYVEELEGALDAASEAFARAVGESTQPYVEGSPEFQPRETRLSYVRDDFVAALDAARAFAEADNAPTA